MKRKLLFFCTSAYLMICTALFSQGIQFIEARTDSDLTLVGKRADEENKLIFIDAYTEWCGPCKWMEKNIFTNDTVAKFYNENFICVRMDLEKGVGISRRYMYEVTAFPAFLFLGFDGIVHRATGARDVKGFIALGETALNPEKRLEHWTKQYQEGKRESAFIREYLKQIRNAGMETKEAADWYFATVKENELLTKEHFEMLEIFIQGYYVNAPKNSSFDLLLNNKEKYIAFVGKEKVEEKIYRVFQNSPYWNYEMDSVIGEMVGKIDLGAIEKLIAKIKQTEFAKQNELLTDLNISYYYEKKDWKKYVEQVVKYVSNYGMENPQTLNDFAWAFYQTPAITEKSAMEQAEKWAKKSVEIANQYYNNDTYAAVLYKLGKKKEALKTAEKAIELGKKDGIDTAGTEELLEKIKQMK